jgi:RNA polymerase sigma-70 factor (ECF subfamily)
MCAIAQQDDENLLLAKGQSHPFTQRQSFLPCLARIAATTFFVSHPDGEISYDAFMPTTVFPVVGSAQSFATTHWSVVLAAKESDASGASVALEKLCRTYWTPLYAYIRRDGSSKADAQDLTQEFFTRLLARGYLQRLDQKKGKFRSFLLGYLKNFLSEKRRNAGAQKRGGGQTLVSLNVIAADEGYLLEPVDELTPDQVFERRWAQAVTQAALNRLREEFARRGQTRLFERLQDFQPREPGGKSYSQLGEEFGMTEAAVKSAVQRMRQRHRELLREEIAHTVTRPEEIDEELRHFRELLGQVRE